MRTITLRPDGSIESDTDDTPYVKTRGNTIHRSTCHWARGGHPWHPDDRPGHPCRRCHPFNETP